APGGLFAPLSREGGLVLNNVLLTTMTGSVLLGTLYPLFLDALTGEKVSVGPPFFNAVILPLAVPLVLAMGAAPLLSWKRGDLTAVVGRLKIATGLAVLVGIIAWAFVARGSWVAGLGLALAIWLILASVTEIIGRVKRGRLAAIPRSAWGAALAHGGLGLFILGMVGTENWQIERVEPVQPGTSIAIGPYDVTFEGVRREDGPNYAAITGTFRVREGGREITVLEPQQRRYASPPMPTSETAIRSTLAADLYAAIAEADNSGAFPVRLYWKPLVIWIWLGALVMTLGGVISLTDRRFRVGAPVRRAGAGATAAADD
ncbi:MAG: heme lyase NrfEFG subunit NrfE, partial [Alphaproteobacteria bacterium]|nr:heme lyase NrfEFG subunit NrfE [Alphaproteobacteria bacterium]